MRRMPFANVALTASAAVMLMAAFPRDPPPRTLGETLATAGQTVSLDGSPTVVLAFHSECSACEVAAPHWRQWLTGIDAQVLAMSPEPYGSARAYADQHGWEVPVLSVPDRPDRWVTPWAYVYDENGTLVWDGTGHQLDLIDPILEQLP